MSLKDTDAQYFTTAFYNVNLTLYYFLIFNALETTRQQTTLL